jgi:hypothetical protein
MHAPVATATKTKGPRGAASYRSHVEPFFARREIGEAGQPAELIQARALALLTLKFEAARTALEGV